MEARKAGIFGVLCICMCALLMGFSDVNALIIQPSWIEFTGEHGTWQNKNITIINDENRTINVTIEPSSAISDCYISRPVLTLEPYESTNITLGVQLYDNTHGFIFYTYDGQQLNQFVLLTPYESNVSVEMIPESPAPGGSIVFLLTPYVTGGGFIYVPSNGNIHYFNISFGMAFVSLSPSDCGDAVAVFQGEDFQARKVFTIKGKENVTYLTIEAPEEVDIDETVAIRLMYGNSPVPDLPIYVTEPDGDEYIKITDSDGTISIKFDKEGMWNFSAEYNGKTATATVTVSGSQQNQNQSQNQSQQQHQQVSLTIVAPNSVEVGEKKWITLKANGNPLPNNPMTVEFPDGSINAYTTNQFGQIQFTFDEVGTYKFTATYMNASAYKEVSVSKKVLNITAPSKGLVGQYVTIHAPAGASIRIEGGENVIVDKVSENGEYAFTPTKAGKYSIRVETATAVGTAEINIYVKPSIVVYDINHQEVEKGEKGKQYLVCVVDKNGDFIKDIDIVKVREPSGFSQDILLVDGQGMWTPELAGVYTLSTEEVKYYAGSTLSLVVGGGGGGGYDVLIGVVVCIAIVGIVSYKYRDRIMARFRGEKGGEEEEEEEEEREEVE